LPPEAIWIRYDVLWSQGFNSDYCSANIRTAFIESGGTAKIVDLFQASDVGTRICALDCLEKLCVEGGTFSNLRIYYLYFLLLSDEIRINFIQIHAIEEVVEALQDLDSGVQISALECLQVLCVHGITPCDLMALLSHYSPDDIRAKFVMSDGIEKVVKRLRNSDSDEQTHPLDFLMTHCVQSTIFGNVSVLISLFFR